MNYGFKQSKLDGSEHQFKIDEKKSKSLPKTLTYENILPEVIDQGQLSICVPCSISAFVNWQLNVDNNEMKADNKIKLMEIYNQRALKNEEGMTFKEALHYLRHHGVSTKKGTVGISEYAMVGSVELLKYALLMNGPCIGGLMVYSETDDKFWEKRGQLLGGHAIAIVGYNEKGFIIRNSWGRLFGNNGYVILPYKEFDNLIELWTLN